MTADPIGLTASGDYRIRKVPSGYRIWQRIGSGWEALAEVYESRGLARDAVARFAAPSSLDMH